MFITQEQILMVVGGASTITTAIFWGAWYLGRLGNQITWLRERVEEHERAFVRIGRRMDDARVGDK